jgi:hypothetical protein
MIPWPPPFPAGNPDLGEPRASAARRIDQQRVVRPENPSDPLCQDEGAKLERDRLLPDRGVIHRPCTWLCRLTSAITWRSGASPRRAVSSPSWNMTWAHGVGSMGSSGSTATGEIVNVGASTAYRTNQENSSFSLLSAKYASIAPLLRVKRPILLK